MPDRSTDAAKARILKHVTTWAEGKPRRSGPSSRDVRFRADCVCFTSRSTTLREKLIKIGAKVVSHGRYVTFQLADVAVLRDLFRDILRLIDELRTKPAPT